MAELSGRIGQEQPLQSHELGSHEAFFQESPWNKKIPGNV